MNDNPQNGSTIDNPHFASAASWADAEAMLTFHPLQPRKAAGFCLQSLRIHVRDHKQRDLPVGSSPEVPPDDIDGRSPAVVVWHDADMFYLVASGELAVEVLTEIAGSMCAPPSGGHGDRERTA